MTEQSNFSKVSKLEVVMEPAAMKDYVKIPKQEYNLLKEVYRTVKRQALLVRIDEAERNLAAGKTKAMSVDDVIASV
jgi:predicted alternative tryptophan synthase beta-subunit